MAKPILRAAWRKLFLARVETEGRPTEITG